MNTLEKSSAVDPNTDRTADTAPSSDARAIDFTFHPLRIPDDIPEVHDWVRRDYARYWGMVGLSVQEVESAYREIVAPEHTDAFLGRHESAACFLIETYRPSRTFLADYYDAEESDRGMHLLVAPVKVPISGFTRAVFSSVMRFLFDDPEAERVVVEPDVRNTKIRALNRYAGFVEARTIDLPETATTPAKTAMLSFCSREAFVAREPGRSR
ncbi:MAG: GNAT family N-acetyltransferase [Myxococcota bacterium]